MNTLTHRHFFGYHRHRIEYQMGDAVLKLYIPERDKENLPLSAAVFRNGVRYYLKNCRQLQMDSPRMGCVRSQIGISALLHGLIESRSTAERSSSAATDDITYSHSIAFKNI